MLRHLRVTNFAILSDVAIELGAGMNVLTGETGAGKSLIVEAVNLLRGGRASADIPRAGADEAVVEAIVEVPHDLRARVASVLDGAGLPRNEDAEHEVFIRRVIQRGGRSRTYVNGALTTAARLAELGALLIDLSGQHQHQGLVDPSRHLELIDAFSRTTHPADAALVEAMTAAWSELRACDAELAELGGDERERESRIDYLRYQLEELESANLKPGEDTAIELERSRLASVDQLQSAARRAEQLLYGDDDSARDRVALAARELDRVLRADPSLESITRQCSEIETLIDDASDQLRSYADKLEGDPERLAYLDERLALIRRLVRKHGATTTSTSTSSSSASLGLPHGTPAGRPTATAPRTSTGAWAGTPVGMSAKTSAGTSAKTSAGTSAKTSAGTSAGTSAETSAGWTGRSNGRSAGTPAAATEMSTRESTSASTSLSNATSTASHASEPSALDIVLAKAAELRAELDALTGRDDLLANLATRRSKAEAAATSAAAALTKSRTKSARKLEKQVTTSLAELGMSSAQLTIVIEPRPLGPTGSDRIEMMLASNKGEDARPLAKIASGGELSRIMLALKLALRRADEVATYVFDEVDTGIGGATAQVVGAQIRAVASCIASASSVSQPQPPQQPQQPQQPHTAQPDSGRQVLCVTHLPQIAAFADHHFHVEKTEIGGRTETHVRKLTAAARKDELARMLGGHATAKARAHAAELLAEAATFALSIAANPPTAAATSNGKASSAKHPRA